MRLALLGGGRMGEALAAGLLDAGWEAEALAVAEVDADRRHALEARFPACASCRSPAWAVADADVVVRRGEARRRRSPRWRAAPTCSPTTRSCCRSRPGVTIATLEAVAARAPGRAGDAEHAGALVGAAPRRSRPGSHATELDLELAERVLGAVGIVVRVPETQLDAVTGLSGSGPAYVFLLAEAMIEAGVLVGLPRETPPSSSSRQTLLGAATLLGDGDETPRRCAPRSRHRAAPPRPASRCSRRTASAAAFLDAVAAATHRSERAGRRR